MVCVLVSSVLETIKKVHKEKRIQIESVSLGMNFRTPLRYEYSCALYLIYTWEQNLCQLKWAISSPVENWGKLEWTVVKTRRAGASLYISQPNLSIHHCNNKQMGVAWNYRWSFKKNRLDHESTHTDLTLSYLVFISQAEDMNSPYCQIELIISVRPRTRWYINTIFPSWSFASLCSPVWQYRADLYQKLSMLLTQFLGPR